MDKRKQGEKEVKDVDWKRIFSFSFKDLFPYLIVFFHDHLFILLSALRWVHTLFQSKCSTDYDLELLLLISSSLSFPQGDPVAAYVFFLVCLLLLPTLVSFLQ